MGREKEDVSKLPEWAQVRMKTLESNVHYWRKRAYQASGEHGPSRVVVNDSFSGSDGNLPNDARVRFFTEDKNQYKFIECHLEEGGLHLYADATIVITCHASNVCTVNTQR